MQIPGDFGFSITGRGKVLVAYLQGQSSPAGRTHGPDKSPDFYGWCGGGAGVSPRLGEERSAAAGRLGT